MAELPPPPPVRDAYKRPYEPGNFVLFLIGLAACIILSLLLQWLGVFV